MSTMVLPPQHHSKEEVSGGKAGLMVNYNFYSRGKEGPWQRPRPCRRASLGFKE